MTDKITRQRHHMGRMANRMGIFTAASVGIAVMMGLTINDVKAENPQTSPLATPPSLKISIDQVAPVKLPARADNVGTINSLAASTAPHAGDMAHDGAKRVEVAEQSVISNPRGTIANFDAAALGPVLSELGISWKAQSGPQGQTLITANIGGQLGVNFIPTACLNGGTSNCIGMNTIAYFTGGAPSQQTIAAFNQKYWFASAGIVNNGQAAYLSRYDIADYGIARGNIASSITNFAYLAELLRRELAVGGRTVSLDGYADDLSAGFLNRQGLDKIAGAAQPQSLLDHHTAAFERTPQMINDYLKAPQAPKNKIANVTVK